ncbi:MAG: orotidine 5-phosphate decarboxylase [Pseudomonadota bacterium]
METVPLQISDVIYNAATQSFEALVRVHDATGTRRYACAIDAPIDMPFKEAARGLSRQALRRHNRGLTDSVIETTAFPRRANRAPAGRPDQSRAAPQHAHAA